jgi:DNA-binding NarL/FixJ family response regulator
MDLSPAQLKVVAAVARGKQDKEVAKELGISIHTAKAHLVSAMDRLGLHSRVEIATWYLRNRIRETVCKQSPNRPWLDIRKQLLCL